MKDSIISLQSHKNAQEPDSAVAYSFLTPYLHSHLLASLHSWRGPPPPFGLTAGVLWSTSNNGGMLLGCHHQKDRNLSHARPDKRTGPWLKLLRGLRSRRERNHGITSFISIRKIKITKIKNTVLFIEKSLSFSFSYFNLIAFSIHINYIDRSIGAAHSDYRSWPHKPRPLLTYRCIIKHTAMKSAAANNGGRINPSMHRDTSGWSPLCTLFL